MVSNMQFQTQLDHALERFLTEAPEKVQTFRPYDYSRWVRVWYIITGRKVEAYPLYEEHGYTWYVTTEGKLGHSNYSTLNKRVLFWLDRDKLENYMYDSISKKIAQRLKRRSLTTV